MSEAIGWYAFFFFLGALLSGVLVFAALWTRRSAQVEVQPTDAKPAGAASEKAKAAWVDDDLEKGEAAKAVPVEELKQTLRQLLESEFKSRGDVKADQLDRLADKALAIGNLRAAAAASEAASNSIIGVSGTDTRTPNSSDRSGRSLPVEEMAAPPSGASPAPPPPPVPAPVMRVQGSEARREEGVDEDDDSSREPHQDFEVPNSQLAFGPTDKQLGLVEPPERCTPMDQDVALHNSFATVQKVLHKRDTQTTELHKQLRQARQELWIQTTEARAANARLHEFLTDPSRAPAAQAEALGRLRAEASELSSRLADAREQAKQWQTIARRQRAYFLQSENMGQESMMLLRRHPAGEVFIVPPPVAAPFEEDDMALGDATGWNVGRSHCNPYEVDSWPFEPNVLAARASREPNLPQCEEGDEIEDDDDDDDDDALDAHFPLQGQRPVRGHRQAPCTEWSDDDEEEEPLADDDDGSPALGPGDGLGDGIADAADDPAEQSGESL